MEVDATTCGATSTEDAPHTAHLFSTAASGEQETHTDAMQGGHTAAAAAARSAVALPPGVRKARTGGGVKPRVVVWAHGTATVAIPQPAPVGRHPPGQYYTARPWTASGGDGAGQHGVPPCDNCGATESPQWRKGPPHAPRLCNACGARYLRTRTLEPSSGGQHAGPRARRPSMSNHNGVAVSAPPPPAPPSRRLSQNLVSAAAAMAASHGGGGVKSDGGEDGGIAASADPASPMHAHPHAHARTSTRNAVAAAAPVPFSPGGAANVLLMLLGVSEGGEAAPGAAAFPASTDAAAADGLDTAAKRLPPARRRSSVGAGLATALNVPPGTTTHRGGIKRKLEGLHAIATDTLCTPGGDAAKLDTSIPTPVVACDAPVGGKSSKRSRGANGAGFVRSASASASDDDHLPAGPSVAASGAPSAGALIPRQKTHRPWTLAEVRALVDGVAVHGRGQWADIKASAGTVLATRSSVDVKDKWRNLLRIASLPIGVEPRRCGDALPHDLLNRVRALSAPMPMQGGGFAAPDGAALAAPAAELPPPQAQPAAPPLIDVAALPTVPLEHSGEAAGGVARSKPHSPWTLEESTALVEGVTSVQGCKWTAIKAMNDPRLSNRTAIDLKDRWRNLLNAQSSRRKQDVPQELLERVLALENEFGVGRRKQRAK